MVDLHLSARFYITTFYDEFAIGILYTLRFYRLLLGFIMAGKLWEGTRSACEIGAK